MAVIQLARPHARGGYLFPNSAGGVMSDMTMIQHMKRAGLEARPHGFRSSLRDWMEEAADPAPYEVKETTLGHSVGERTERAYRRTDYLDQRRPIMEAWASFVSKRKA